MLGQRGELLQNAARPGEQVAIGVLGEMQTAIVEAGAQVLVNFNHFFQEASGLLLPAENLTVTISRQLLDESGMPLPGTVEELSPRDGRVSVSVGGDARQQFVNIASAVLNDSGVYTIEVCSQRGSPEEVCLSASVTLFVLDCELKCVVLLFSSIVTISLMTHTHIPSLPSGTFLCDVQQHCKQPGEFGDCGLLI